MYDVSKINTFSGVLIIVLESSLCSKIFCFPVLMSFFTVCLCVHLNDFLIVDLKMFYAHRKYLETIWKINKHLYKFPSIYIKSFFVHFRMKQAIRNAELQRNQARLQQMSAGLSPDQSVIDGLRVELLAIVEQSKIGV